MTLNAWNWLPDPEAPKNLREGEPYNDPKFEELARTYGIWGTAQAALCAQFWQAARRAPVVPHDVEAAAEAIYEADKRMWLTSEDYQQLHDVDKDRLRAMARAAMAAAPQPPEGQRSENLTVKNADGLMPGNPATRPDAAPVVPWVRVIDEAMVLSHLGVADASDDYATAKEKLNRLICWEIDVSKYNDAAAPNPPACNPSMQPSPELATKSQ